MKAAVTPKLNVSGFSYYWEEKNARQDQKLLSTHFYSMFKVRIYPTGYCITCFNSNKLINFNLFKKSILLYSPIK